MLVVEGVEWKTIYWIHGAPPKSERLIHPYAVSDPPCSGWQQACILPVEQGRKSTVIFCPFTFKSYNVPARCAEILLAKEPKDKMTKERLIELLEKMWARYRRLNMQVDFEEAGQILMRLGKSLPEEISMGAGATGVMPAKRSGGKDTGQALIAPVKKDGKRGKFLAWFLEAGGSRHIKEAMAHFDTTRSNVLSYLFLLQKNHGIGYVLARDVATIELPPGVVDPFI